MAAESLGNKNYVKTDQSPVLLSMIMFHYSSINDLSPKIHSYILTCCCTLYLDRSLFGNRLC